MLNDDGGTLRAVAWSEICPWLSLVRCFRLAIRFRLLLLSAVAILLTVSGWAVLVPVFSGGDEEIGRTWKHLKEEHHGCPWVVLTDLVPDKPSLPRLGVDFAAEESASIFDRSPEPFWGSFTQLSRPLRRVFSSDVTVTRLAFLLLCGLWALAVWAFFGGAITRIVAVELAREERVGWGPMMRYARSRWKAYFTAPLLPVVGVLVSAFGMGIVGLLLRSNVGLLIAGLLLWPLMLLGGLVMAFLLLWLAFGWPLMWATVSAEGEDCFDALSRSHQYVFHRPLHYLFYALVAVVLGWLGWLVVSNFAAGVIALTNWAADWGADTSRWLAVAGTGGRRLELLLSENAEIGSVGRFGAGLILFWCGCVKMLAVGFLYSYFWTASTCIYFLLRRDADATELDEVFLDEEEDEPTYGLPPLETDDAGAPVVADDTVPPRPGIDLSHSE